MDKTKTINVLAGVIIPIAFLSIVTMPLMIHRKAVSRSVDIAKKALDYWKSGDSATGRMLWEDPQKFPSIYDLESYQIDKVTNKRKSGALYVNVFVTIDFASSSLTPSGKMWVFEVRHKSSVPIILNFHQVDSL